MMMRPSLGLLKEQLLDALPTPIRIKDLDGVLLYQNEAARCEIIAAEKTVEIRLEDANGTFSAMAECYCHPPAEQQQHDWGERQVDLPRAESGRSLAEVHDNSEISYRTLFKNMPTGAVLGEVVTNENNEPVDFIILDVNPAFDDFTGLVGNDAIGKHITSVVPEMASDPIDWIKQFGAVALGGPTYIFRSQRSTSLGRWFGGVAYRQVERKFVTIFMDVSEQFQAEEALRESEERHRNLFESMMQGVVYQDASGAIIAANPSAERILGLTVDQMMGRTSIDSRWRSLHEDGTDFPGDTHPAMVALRTGKPEAGVVMGVYHPTDLKVHWILIDAIPRFRSGDPEPYQVYTTFTDLTETKEFERKIVYEKERAEMADRLKSSFLANMSHEIRTPLNGIMGHIDLALSNELAESFKTYNMQGLRVAMESGKLLLSIIEDILDLSKIEAGQLDVKSDEAFSLKGIVDQTLSLGHTMIQQRRKSIELVQNKSSGVGDTICGDPFRLQQVLNNLVSNAIKFTDKGSVKITISRSSEAVLEICVADTGKGIPIDHIETIFDSFRQVEIGDTRNHGGTGLGLTISRKLAELMGGSLRVESSTVESNKGSRFYLKIPYVPSMKSLVGSPVVATERTKSQATKGNYKILVAEDEVVSRRLVKRMLEVSGYQVLVAEDGQQAVEIFKENPDTALILMDVQMPNMDGLQATESIRKLEESGNSRVPIIALSAGAMKGDHEQGLAVGMTDYLTKPVNLKLLVQTLQSFLGKAN